MIHFLLSDAREVVLTTRKITAVSRLDGDVLEEGGELMLALDEIRTPPRSHGKLVATTVKPAAPIAPIEQMPSAHLEEALTHLETQPVRRRSDGSGSPSRHDLARPSDQCPALSIPLQRKTSESISRAEEADIVGSSVREVHVRLPQKPRSVCGRCLHRPTWRPKCAHEVLDA